MIHDARYHREASCIWLSIITLPPRDSFTELQKTSFLLDDEGTGATGNSEERYRPILHPRYHIVVPFGTH